MKKFRPFHPAMPNPTHYFAEESRSYWRECLWQLGARAVLIGIVFYLFGVMIFSIMPE